MKLFISGKVKELHKRSLELSQALDKWPSVKELKPLQLVLEELCEAGYWPAHKSLAVLYGKMIWITLDWGEREFNEASPDEMSKIRSYTDLGLLQLLILEERGGKKIDADMAADVERFRQEFLKYDPRRMT